MRACEPEPLAASREPLFVSPERIPLKKSKNGHDALIWYLYIRARPAENETGLTTSNRTVTRFFFLFRIPNVSEEKYGSDEPVVKKETVGKFWLTEITGPTPDGIPNTLRICWSEETDRNFRNLCIGIRGLHVSMHCSMESQVMESFLSSFQFYELSMLLNYQIYLNFGTVAASKVNGVS